MLSASLNKAFPAFLVCLRFGSVPRVFACVRQSDAKQIRTICNTDQLNSAVYEDEERDVGGSIPHGGFIELFFVPASTPLLD